MNDLWHSITMFTIVNGGQEEVFPGQSAKSFMCLAPAFHRARNGDTMDSVARHGCGSVLSKKLDGQFLWRPPARIQAIELAGLCLPVNEEKITADAVHHWLGNTKHGV